MGYQNNTLTNGSMGAGTTFQAIGKAGAMADITIFGYARPYSSQHIYCTLLDTYGREIKKMYWYDNDEVISPRGTTPARYGWYNDKGNICYNETDEVKGGEALWFTVDQDYTLVWPKVLDAE